MVHDYDGTLCIANEHPLPDLLCDNGIIVPELEECNHILIQECGSHPETIRHELHHSSLDQDHHVHEGHCLVVPQ